MIEKLLCFAALAGSAVFGQAFEVADVHASPTSLSSGRFGPSFRGGRYEARRITLLNLISLAYGVTIDRIAGGPNWLDYDKFDIIAKAPADTTLSTQRLMLQALLADRFKLAVHNDNVPQPQYAL